MTIHYKDVSHHNGDYHPTGPTAAKATEGTSFVDAQYGTTRSRTLAGGWPFIAYHWLHHTNIALQVSHVIATIGHGKPLMLDVEHSTDDPNLADVYAFADQYKAAGGLVTLAYIPHWYWAGHMGSPSMTGLTSRGIGLISSLYDPRGYTDAATYPDGEPTGWAAYGGVHPVTWQYTSTPLDTNAFKGTQAALADLWSGDAGGNPDQPVTPPSEDDDVGTVDTFSPAAIKQLLESPINNSGTTLAFALQQGQNTVLLQTILGSSGPNVGVALQGTYQKVMALAAALEPASLANLVAEAVTQLPSGIDVNEATLQTALVGALKELAASAPTEVE